MGRRGKFRIEILKKLLKSKETFGDDTEKVVNVCAETIYTPVLMAGGPPLGSIRGCKTD
ncbi:hypothetical protein QJS10_CPA05g01901 [Acorus calamus]|uniref:Uncharacterized protein n=1 Tax=Acorus calamus TaxID=4465 RepID=A0AAV9EVR9_ACOCL|nr:hypothetical protein QJS10_CPA05g01901 [Acorus calamus]